MKKHRNPVRIWAAAAGILVLMLGMMHSFAAETIDLDRTGFLSLNIHYEGKPVQGGDVRLYYVAGIEVRDGYHYKLVDKLQGNDFDLENISDPDLAVKMQEAVEKAGIEGTLKEFDENGFVKFENLPLGLYLVVQETAAKGFEKLNPVLVSIPMYEDGTYVYDVDASPKLTLKKTGDDSSVPPKESSVPNPPTPKHLPQTGQLNWPVPVLAALGILFLLIGVILLRVRRKNA